MSPRVSFTVWQPGCSGVWGRQGSKEGVSPKWAGGGIRIGDHLHSGAAREAGVKHAKNAVPPGQENKRNISFYGEKQS